MFRELVICTVIYVCWKVIHFAMNRDKKANSGNRFGKRLKTKDDNPDDYPVIQLSEESEVKVDENVSKTKTNSYANISHKRVCGANNWLNFVQTQPPKNNCPLNETKQRQTYSKANSKHSKLGTNQPNEGILRTPVCTNNKIVRPITMPDREQILPTNGSNFKSEKDEKSKDPIITKQIAMDCEMVGVDVGVNNNMLARVSLVNALGDCIYDKYVKPTEPIVDYRTHVSGIRPKDLIDACEFEVVQKEIADILKGRILVGHALKNDLNVLYLSHPKRMMRDTSKFYKFREGRTPALKKLVKKYLGATIQEGEHSSVQDALATMQLYRMFRKDWEASLRPFKKIKQKAQDPV
uniref:RNA exonuclease 4 n=1 Tax=Graphocephala atropunctata TaxID=36148 RepID=A0A1B6KL54_9HEMI